MIYSKIFVVINVAVCLSTVASEADVLDQVAQASFGDKIQIAPQGVRRNLLLYSLQGGPQRSRQ